MNNTDTTETIKIAFEVDKNQLEKGLKSAQKTVDKITKADNTIELEADTEKLETGISRASAEIKKLSLIKLAGLVGGILAVGKAFDFVTDQASAFIATTAQFEQYTTVLTSITGSSLEAEKSMDWITEFATKTPYQLDNVTSAFVKMKAYGLDPMDGTLGTLGDTASAMGKDINQAVEAMADAVMGENERLKEFGIKASKQGETIAYMWTDSSNKARKVIIQNDKDIIQSTLNAIWNEKYAGAMDAQSKTWNGLINNISDKWTNFQKEAMSAGLFDYLKAGLMTVSSLFSTVLEDTMGGAKNFSDLAIEGIKTIILAVGNFRDLLTGVTTTYSAVKVAFMSLVVGIGTGINMINTGWDASMVGMQNGFKGFVDAVGEGFYAMVNYILEKTSDMVNSISQGLQGAFDFIGVDNPFSEINLSMGEYESGIESATAKTEDLINLDWANLTLDTAIRDLNAGVDSLINEDGLRSSQNIIADIDRNLIQLNTSYTKSSKDRSKALDEHLKKVGLVDKATAKAGKTQSSAAQQSKDDLKKLAESADLLSKDYSTAFSGMFDSILDGNVQEGFQTLFDDLLHITIEPFVKSMSDTLAEGLTEMILGEEAYTAVVISEKAIQGSAAAAAGIANQATSGDPYTAWVRMAAMAASMAALGFVVSSFGGGSSDKYTPTYAEFSTGSTGSLSDDVNSTVNLDSDGIKMALEDYNAILKIAEDNQMSFNKSMDAYIELVAEAERIWDSATTSLRQFNIGVLDYQDALDATYSIGSFDELNEFFENFYSDSEKRDAAIREATYLYNLMGQELPESSEAARAEVTRWLDIYANATDAVLRSEALLNASTAAAAANAYAEIDGALVSVASSASSCSASASSCSASASSCADAADTVLASLTDIASLTANWMEDLAGTKFVLDSVITDTGLDGIDATNFLEEFAKASASGMTESQLDDWSELSDALKSYTDAVENSAQLLQDLLTAKNENWLQVVTIQADWDEFYPSDWYPYDSVQVAEDLLRATQIATGLTAVDADNFSSSFNTYVAMAEVLDAEILADYQRLADAIQAVAAAEQERIDQLNANAITTINIESAWIDDAVQTSKDLLDATIVATEIYGVTFENFLSEFTKATEEGLDAEELADWSSLSSALLAVSSATDAATASLLAEADAQALLEQQELDRYNTAMSNYIKGFYTDQEQYDIALAELTDSFNDLGVQIPSTDDAFRTYIEGMDTSTDSSYELYLSLLELSTEFDKLTDTVDAMELAELERYNSAISSYIAGFYTDKEQYDIALESLTDSFDALGVQIPSTDEEFRDYMDAMALSSGASSELYLSLLELSSEFDALTDSADALAEAESSISDLEDATTSMLQSIVDAWTGSLSYLSDAQKALYLEGYLALPGTEDTNVDGINTTDTMDTVSAAKLAAELALTSTATSEEYQPFFDRYIQELEQVDEDASRTDIVNELIALRAEITDLRESSLDIAIHS